jgi:hypothetical protein
MLSNKKNFITKKQKLKMISWHIYLKIYTCFTELLLNF